MAKTTSVRVRSLWYTWPAVENDRHHYTDSLNRHINTEWTDTLGGKASANATEIASSATRQMRASPASANHSTLALQPAHTPFSVLFIHVAQRNSTAGAGRCRRLLSPSPTFQTSRRNLLSFIGLVVWSNFNQLKTPNQSETANFLHNMLRKD